MVTVIKENDFNRDVNEVTKQVSKQDSKQSTLYIPIGVPGCGKSTFVKGLSKEYDDVVVIETDKIREELTGSQEDQTQNKKVFEIAHSRLDKGLANDVSGEKVFVFDATNISKWARKSIIDIGKKYNAKIIAVVITTPLGTCLKQNRNRDRVVPEDVIIRMFRNLEEPDKSEGFDEIQYY